MREPFAAPELPAATPPRKPVKPKREEPTILVHRVGSRLIPHAPMDEAFIRAFDASKPLRVRLSQPRNVKRLRFYWALLTLICDNLDQPLAPETLHELVKVRLGYTITVKMRKRTYEIPGSIAFDKMKEPEFKRFLERFKDFMMTEVIPGTNSAEFERQALEYMADKYDDGR